MCQTMDRIGVSTRQEEDCNILCLQELCFYILRYSSNGIVMYALIMPLVLLIPLLLQNVLFER